MFEVVILNIAIFEFNTLEFVKNEYLVSTVKFDIRSIFSKGSGLSFSEGPCPDKSSRQGDPNHRRKE